MIVSPRTCAAGSTARRELGYRTVPEIAPLIANFLDARSERYL
ncbi:hypothetical protein [Nocardia sp. NPDC049707]